MYIDEEVQTFTILVEPINFLTLLYIQSHHLHVHHQGVLEVAKKECHQQRHGKQQVEVVNLVKLEIEKNQKAWEKMIKAYHGLGLAQSAPWYQ